MSKILDSYSVLAPFYDKLISGYPYEKAIGFICDKVGRKGIDLGTGSGKFAIALSEKGHSVVGVDSSSQMLEFARKNAKERGVSPIFVMSDMMELDFTRVDFVLAMCDVFNYLSGYKDFETLAKRIFGALNDKGCLIFDVSSEYKLKNMAGEQYFEDREDITYLWCNSLHKNKLTMNIAYFIPESGEKYVRRDEVHEMFVYDADKLVDILTKIGYTIKVYGEKLTKLKEKSNRVFFFCEKK